MKNRCNFKGCDRKVYYIQQELCQGHYMQLWRNGWDLKPLRKRRKSIRVIQKAPVRGTISIKQARDAVKLVMRNKK